MEIVLLEFDFQLKVFDGGLYISFKVNANHLLRSFFVGPNFEYISLINDNERDQAYQSQVISRGKNPFQMRSRAFILSQ